MSTAKLLAAVNVLVAAEFGSGIGSSNWFTKMSKEKQEEYMKAHPHSKMVEEAKQTLEKNNPDKTVRHTATVGGRGPKDKKAMDESSQHVNVPVKYNRGEGYRLEESDEVKKAHDDLVNVAKKHGFVQQGKTADVGGTTVMKHPDGTAAYIDKNVPRGGIGKDGSVGMRVKKSLF